MTDATSDELLEQCAKFEKAIPQNLRRLRYGK